MNKTHNNLTPQKKSFNFMLSDLSPLSALKSNGKNIKIQYLLSPKTPSKDLFSVLLGSQTKNNYQLKLRNQDIMEEQSYDQFQMYNEIQSNVEQQQISDCQSSSDQQDLGRKRKRKSSNQIKMLKAQLDVESNWNKQKIYQMSQKTGLSQSQVYKWWWDQKKKNGKYQIENIKNLMKKKIIRKQNHRHAIAQKNIFEYEITQYDATKIKGPVQIEAQPETQKKINKRLLF